MENITELFENLLKTFRRVDIANREFRRMLDDDEELREQYAQWCDENGSSQRYGFQDFAEQYIENQNSIWDSLTDYDT